MKEMVPLSGLYRNLGWDHDKRDAVIQEFVQAINETRMSGIGVGSKWGPGTSVKRSTLIFHGGQSSSFVWSAF
jgi:hypothetical protein